MNRLHVSTGRCIGYSFEVELGKSLHYSPYHSILATFGSGRETVVVTLSHRSTGPRSIRSAPPQRLRRAQPLLTFPLCLYLAQVVITDV